MAEHNHLLRAAREAHPSSLASGGHLSRAELAEASMRGCGTPPVAVMTSTGTTSRSTSAASSATPLPRTGRRCAPCWVLMPTKPSVSPRPAKPPPWLRRRGAGPGF